jgi:hypothetical protein
MLAYDGGTFYSKWKSFASIQLISDLLIGAEESLALLPSLVVENVALVRRRLRLERRPDSASKRPRQECNPQASDVT